MTEIRVVVADDHIALRESLATYIDAQPDMVVVGQASDGVEAIARATAHVPDVVLLDLSMPGHSGVDVIAELRARLPGVRTLVLTMHEARSFLRAALDAGAAGYVTKRAASDELLRAIRDVARGRSYLNVSLRDDDSTQQPSARRPTPAVDERLSARERHVLGKVAHGYTSKEIAAELGVSPATIDTYRLRIADKLGLKSRVDLVRYALDHGLLGGDRG